jgi:hypothetical protein
MVRDIEISNRPDFVDRWRAWIVAALSIPVIISFISIALDDIDKDVTDENVVDPDPDSDIDEDVTDENVVDLDPDSFFLKLNDEYGSDAHYYVGDIGVGIKFDSFSSPEIRDHFARTNLIGYKYIIFDYEFNISMDGIERSAKLHLYRSIDFCLSKDILTDSDEYLSITFNILCNTFDNGTRDSLVGFLGLNISDFRNRDMVHFVSLDGNVSRVIETEMSLIESNQTMVRIRPCFERVSGEYVYFDEPPKGIQDIVPEFDRIDVIIDPIFFRDRIRFEEWDSIPGLGSISKDVNNLFWRYGALNMSDFDPESIGSNADYMDYRELDPQPIPSEEIRRIRDYILASDITNYIQNRTANLRITDYFNESDFRSWAVQNLPGKDTADSIENVCRYINSKNDYCGVYKNGSKFYICSDFACDTIAAISIAGQYDENLKYVIPTYVSTGPVSGLEGTKHGFVGLIALEKSGKFQVSFIDTTFSDSKLGSGHDTYASTLNAINTRHYFTQYALDVPTSILALIKDLKSPSLDEKIGDIDPDAHYEVVYGEEESIMSGIDLISMLEDLYGRSASIDCRDRLVFISPDDWLEDPSDVGFVYVGYRLVP